MQPTVQTSRTARIALLAAVLLALALGASLSTPVAAAPPGPNERTLSPESPRMQAFTKAVKSADLNFVAQMHGLGLNAEVRDELRNSLLTLAIRDGDGAFAMEMLELPEWRNPHVIEQENQLGETPLMIAAIRGATDVAHRLLDLGAELNRQGWSALHYAATAGKVDMIKLLIEYNAYVDAHSPNGTTALMMAARFNHRPAAAALLAFGADPTLRNEAGLTARDYALKNTNRDLAFWLEIEEVSFTNRYLKRVPKVKPDATLEEVVIQSGGEVTTVQPSGLPGGEEGGAEPVLRPGVSPSPDTEVFRGIR